MREKAHEGEGEETVGEKARETDRLRDGETEREKQRQREGGEGVGGE